MSDELHGVGENTDRELWREPPGDYYAPSVHVTKDGGLGINVAGTVHVMRLRDWHRLAADKFESLRLHAPPPQGDE